jgi:hypothetical protein
MLSIRRANPADIAAIEGMVSDFVKVLPAANHPRSSQLMR